MRLLFVHQNFPGQFRHLAVTLAARPGTEVRCLPHPVLVGLLQVSRVHAYLTYPFVLSWSLLEAMSAGCAIVASDTAPVREVIDPGVTGRLVDFFDVPGLAEEVCRLLGDGDERAHSGANARAFVQTRYDLNAVCLPRQIRWIDELAA